MELFFNHLGPTALFIAQFAGMIIAAIHAILSKDDPRSASGWVAVIVLVPFVGWLTYWILGINRIERRARELRSGSYATGIRPLPPANLANALIAPKEETQQLVRLAELGQKIFPSGLMPGNFIRVLKNGDQAYPAMIAAIEKAEHSIALSSYIFNCDKAGLAFLAALTRARERGVEIRILLDGVGAWYSFPSMVKRLEQAAIPHARFLHSFMPWQMPYLNMRCHQKILVVDGLHGFTGGMNIAEGNLVIDNPRHPIRDYHFSVEGPLVTQLMLNFAHEWAFTADEELSGEAWFPDIPVHFDKEQSVIARGIASGPDLKLNAIRWTLMGALAEASNYIRIVTPYFVPDGTLKASLCLAAMRGIRVDIVLPENNNLPYVAWASQADLGPLIQAGCHVWMVPGPFEHSKLMTIDGYWSLVGSSNWDTRSLRLNFEFDLECYGASFARTLDQIIEAKIESARELTIADIAARPFLVRLRDSTMRLFSPYL